MNAEGRNAFARPATEMNDWNFQRAGQRLRRIRNLEVWQVARGEWRVAGGEWRAGVTGHRSLSFLRRSFDVGCSMLDTRCFPPPLAPRPSSPVTP